MSALTPAVADRPAFAAWALARAARRVRHTVASAVVLVGAGAWLLFAVVATAIPLIVDRAGNEMDAGVLYVADYIIRWVAFGTGVAVFAALLPTHLAAGGTRRSLRTGAFGAAMLAGLAYGVLCGLATAGERGLFAALGWSWEPPDGGLAGEGGALGGLAGTAAAEALIVTVYVLVACAVVAGYQSSGVWRGTLLVVPGIALLALAELAVASGGVDDALGRFLRVDGTLGVVVGLVGGVAVVALATAWLHLRLRTLRLRPTR